MWKQRTDLALEAQELRRQNGGGDAIAGVRTQTEQCEGCRVDTVRVLDGRGAQALGKPPGRYVTLSLDALERKEEDAFGRTARALAAQLKTLLGNLASDAPVLVAGLGNRSITPDAVGPMVHEHTMITRHLVQQLPEQFGTLRPVASLSAGVLGTTGMESGALIRAVCREVQPACVVAVDALASRSLERVCRCVQLADTGIVPGSGVGNSRSALDRAALGVPVIAVGVPTVVDGGTLVADLLGAQEPPELAREARTLMVTPRDIDARVADLAKVIGFGINLALHPSLSIGDVELFLS